MASVSVKHIDLNILNMKTRMPFRYGIAALVAVPHLFVRVEAEFDGKIGTGISADGLPPKWFTKNPEVPFSADLEEMFAVIRQACRLAAAADPADTVFEFWLNLYAAQKEWAVETTYPPLLWAFGVSLVERALIDAFCRIRALPFGRALTQNAFGIRLGEIHQELDHLNPIDLLQAEASRSIWARHTVGLTDPLTDADIPDEERLNDGLPQSLEASVLAYGLNHLKIKLWGDVDKDLGRLRQIASLLERHVGKGYAFTLDGNEQYTEIEPFREVWNGLVDEPALSGFMEGLLFVEQPLRRDVALSSDVGIKIRDWIDRPPLIIDESDGTLTSSAEALECGYSGTSHKNCKGVFKGVANACLMASRKRLDPEGDYVLSSEDLANVGPVAMLQDLSVLASLGVSHAERNGHHYFAGLSMYPDKVQADVLESHQTLYRRHDSGFPTLDVRGGQLDLGSVVDAPFGYGFELDTRQFTPADDWSEDSLET